MKSSIAMIVAGAGLAIAQGLGDLPPCGQTCIGNMVQIATSQFKCKTGDIKCYCANVDFGNGVRDCSNQSCPKADAAKVIDYGTQYCKNSGAAPGSPVSNGSPSAVSVAVTTTPLVATIVSGSQTILSTTGLSTVFGPAPGAASTAASVIVSALSSAASAASASASSAESAASSTAASASDASSSAASSASTAASSRAASATASTTSSAGAAAPLKTAGPLLGAAGIAALLVL